MLAFVGWRGRWSQCRPLLRRPVVWVIACGVAGYQAFFFAGLERTGVAVGTLVALGSAPLLAGLLGWLAQEGAPGWLWLAATVVALAGLALLTGGGSVDPIGVGFALLAGGSYAVYTVFGARLARDGHSPSVVLAVSFTIGALILVPFLATAGWVWSAGGMALALWLGLAATSLAYLLFGLGLPVLQPGHIATLTLLEPVGATMLGVMVLGESLPAAGWLGCALILLGLAVVGLGERR
ncbi:MAG: EamA family transporter [Candidatus Nanopelagicales bacterium]|nr:EamA family transporter [Candidatus Nanopelagicales bacterium]